VWEINKRQRPVKRDAEYSKGKGDEMRKAKGGFGKNSGRNQAIIPKRRIGF